MQKPSEIHVMPLSRKPFKTDFEGLAKEIILKELQAYDCKIFLFGSRATKNNHRFSDMDIGVIPGKNFDAKILFSITEKLNDSVIPFKVQVVNFAAVTETFKQEALKNIIRWKE